MSVDKPARELVRLLHHLLVDQYMISYRTFSQQFLYLLHLSNYLEREDGFPTEGFIRKRKLKQFFIMIFLTGVVSRSGSYVRSDIFEKVVTT